VAVVGTVVVTVPSLVELVAPVVLDVLEAPGSLVDVEPALVVVVVDAFWITDDGVVTVLEGGSFWKTRSRTTVSASTPTPVATATRIS
jgi:hypothetical protein